MTAIAALLQPLYAWIEVHPGAAVAVALVIPWLIAGTALLLGRARAGRPASAPAAAPRIEPAAPARSAPARAGTVEAAPPAVAPPPPVVAPEPTPAPVLPPEPAPAPVEVPAPIEAPAPVTEAPRPRARLVDRLARTRSAFVGRLGQLVAGRSVDAALLEELEALLFSADLGVQTAESLLETVRREAPGGDAERVRGVLREATLAKLRRVEAKPEALDQKPHVVLVLGVNGSGKTTTIGKLAAHYQAAGRRAVLGAGDTFRAAAIEQLEVWGERVGCEVIKGQAGGDPAAVAFDTVKAAKARGYDVAIIDTAGRLQTKAPLVEELRKIVRVIGRDCEGAPHEVLLVLDANTGQNAISQARIFTEAAGVTGLVLTKLDGTARGGVLIGLADEFGIPVRYVGVGEAPEDLRPFDATEFVDALFASESGGTA